MVDTESPNEAPDTTPRRRVRWWFPAMFAVSTVAAAVAIYAWSQRGDNAGQLDVPDLTSLGSEAPEVEDPAPPFTVSTFDGGVFSLAEHLEIDGRPVVLNLWASWCAPCRKEMPAIDAAAARHTDVFFIGVAVQDAFSDSAAFAEEIGVGYTLAFDTTGSVEDGYRPLGLPATFFIDSDGAIVQRYFGELFEETIDQQIAIAFGP